MNPDARIASPACILPAGNGLTAVLLISLSLLVSRISFRALEAPVIRNPASKNNESKISPPANIYPMPAENTTVKLSLNDQQHIVCQPGF